MSEDLKKTKTTLEMMIEKQAEKRLSKDLDATYPSPGNALNPIISFEILAGDESTSPQKKDMIVLKCGELREQVIISGVNAGTIIDLIRKIAFKKALHLYVERETRQFFNDVQNLKGQMDQLEWEQAEQ